MSSSSAQEAHQPHQGLMCHTQVVKRGIHVCTIQKLGSIMNPIGLNPKDPKVAFGKVDL